MKSILASEVSVAFSGVKALDRVSISAERGKVTGLIGPNGSGKTTMLGVMSGLLRPQLGHVFIEETDVTKAPSHRRAKMGLSRTFQRSELWSSMTVYDNVRTAADLAARWLPDLDPHTQTAEALRTVGILGLAPAETTQLTTGQVRLVELARAIAQRPKILLLDEPMAGLGDHEAERLSVALRSLAETGVAILLIEHHIEMVLALCEFVWVLDYGVIIAHGSPEDVRNDAAVRVAYLGTRRAVRN